MVLVEAIKKRGKEKEEKEEEKGKKREGERKKEEGERGGRGGAAETSQFPGRRFVRLATLAG